MIKSFKIFEQDYYKPELKRPIDFKCLDILNVLNNLDIDVRKFFTWAENNENVKVIFPKPQSCELAYEREKKLYSDKRYKGSGIEAIKTNYIEKRAIFELPISYDSSNDVENFNKNKVSFLNRMKKMAVGLGKTKEELIEYEKQLLKNVSFGDKSFEYINKYLGKIHNLYGTHYKNGVIPCYMSEGDDYNVIFDYPILDFEPKAVFISELEKWIDELNMDSDGFYEWILRSDFIEGRYWNRVYSYKISDEENFRKEKTSDNISKINELLKQIYNVEELPIYFDYYKEVNDNIFR